MRVRAAAEIEAEKQRAIGELRAEVADLALAAASRVVGETMNDDRQRRLVEEFLHEAGRGRVEELMAARRDTAARRYAEAAFRDRRCATGPSRRGARSSTWPRPSSRTTAVARSSPTRRSRSTSRDAMVDSAIGSIVSVPVLQPRPAPAPARPDRAAAARRGGVPPPRQRPPGHRPRHRHERLPAHVRTRSAPLRPGSNR